jgi:hypothetical protein
MYIEKKDIPIANDHDVIEAMLHGKKVVTTDTSKDGTYILISYHYKGNIYIVDESLDISLFKKILSKLRLMMNSLSKKFNFSGA